MDLLFLAEERWEIIHHQHKLSWRIETGWPYCFSQRRGGNIPPTRAELACKDRLALLFLAEEGRDTLPQILEFCFRFFPNHLESWCLRTIGARHVHTSVLVVFVLTGSNTHVITCSNCQSKSWTQIIQAWTQMWTQMWTQPWTQMLNQMWTEMRKCGPKCGQKSKSYPTSYSKSYSK